MQTPICEACLISDMLCNACKERLETNKITQVEIDICRFLHTLSQKVRSLQEVRIEKIIESSNIIIIAGKGDAPKLVGKGGAVVKALAKEFKRSVKVIEDNKDMKEFINNLISPANIRGINILFTPEEKIYRIRIPAIYKAVLSVREEDISQIALSLFNNKAEVVFEN